ncbi:MAG: TonB-dependent receptor domain-containing protein [Novosphingobium sp.]
MRSRSVVLALGASVAVASVPQAAWAQRAGENAAASSDDAFGTQIGTEATGIYNEQDTRGLSPLKAGNARLDGIYFDPVASLSGRTRASYGIRVGIAAIDYPFPAPTGIVDNRLRTAGDKFIGSVALTKLQYDGYLAELDFQVPIIKDSLSTYIGLGHAHTVTGDGALIPSLAIAVKPVIKTAGGVEISPFYAATLLYGVHNKPFFLTSGDLVPPQPKLGNYLGQDWAEGRNFSSNFGVTAKAPLAEKLSLTAGLFRSGMKRLRNYSEFMIYSGQGTTARHRLISDPRQDIHSWSGEAQLAWDLGRVGAFKHRLIGGLRARQRYTESGGSDSRDFGLFDYLGQDPEAEPVFTYGPVNEGRVRQTSWLLGYQAKSKFIGTLNLGLQRSSYRASFLDARSGAITTSRDDAWLYNASASLHLARRVEIFLGTQTGLEDSGAAPENALNRNEQLPTTRSTQYEAGLRFRLGKGNQLVLSTFQISRPYFSFDGAGRFAELGEARYRGAELSFVGHFDRLTVLAGAVAMDPHVTGAGRTAGLVGERPAGIPDFYTRIDLQYRTDILGNLTPTVTLTATGPRAMGSGPVAALGGRQAMMPTYAALDLGLRYRFKLADMPANLRFQLQNVFNSTGWKVVNSNTLQPEEHRRVTLALAADF